ncbi:hypothetical protein C0075_05995 [Rhizobium sp. KAs_5_22]|uniref:hypothetical protein n=1 Tax=Ciceribacter selenitireducens TaxID=448181 RepID=UPI0004914232|nr:hypothetical protein [Ciceribacter selenitireducens]PPJ45311.1 hypothetical protein C0075_05995 [Rhizobium sp. KAs_5_22]
MKRRLTSSIAVMSLVAAFPAAAADCPIERAVYAEAETKIEIRFQASGESSPVSHRFVLATPADKMTVEGHVMFDPEIERPVAMAMHNCPEGDVTGADLAACTVWTGIIYASDKAGHVDLLPSEGAGAPESLILPGFGPAVSRSVLGKDLSAMPWDIFELKECAK